MNTRKKIFKFNKNIEGENDTGISPRKKLWNTENENEMKLIHIKYIIMDLKNNNKIITIWKSLYNLFKKFDPKKSFIWTVSYIF